MKLFSPTETFCMEVTLVLLPIVGSKGQVIPVENVRCVVRLSEMWCQFSRLHSEMYFQTTTSFISLSIEILWDKVMTFVESSRFTNKLELKQISLNCTSDKDSIL
jgi:hypothetical protein